MIKKDLQCRFERGQNPAVADYLDRFPALLGADSRVISLIYEEFCLLEERGSSPDVEAFCNRYPAWKDSLASQLRYHQIISQAAGLRTASPRFPEPGEHFEEYELVSLMGRGGSSRVFLPETCRWAASAWSSRCRWTRGRSPRRRGCWIIPTSSP